MKFSRILFMLAFLMSLAVLPVFGQLPNAAIETAIVGEVTKLSSGTISLMQRNGGLQNMTIDNKTTVISSKGTTTISQIKVGDLVGVLTTASSQATEGATKRAQKLFVRVASPSASQAKHLVVGVVTGINASAITLLQKNANETFYTLSASSAAVIKGKGEAAGTGSILLGQRIAVVGVIDEENIISPLLIHILSEKP